MTVPKPKRYDRYERTNLVPLGTGGTIPPYPQPPCHCPDTIPIGDLEVVCRCCGTIFELASYNVCKHYRETHK